MAKSEENELRFAYEYVEQCLDEIKQRLESLEARGWPQPETEYFRVEASTIHKFTHNLIKYITQRRAAQFESAVKALNFSQQSDLP